MERLTPDYLESQIADTQYLQPCGTLTICVLTMKNGLHVIGESACLNPSDFDAAVGQRIARQNAVGKLWQLEGYARASQAQTLERFVRYWDTAEDAGSVDIAVGGTD